jgi:hypothetical protein
MKWVKTVSGQKAHVVFDRHDGRTACGVRLTKAVAIIDRPEPDDRCGGCDAEWRREAIAASADNRPKRGADRRSVYEPQYTFRDWEES